MNVDYKDIADKEEDFCCCICLANFKDDDHVTELKCAKKHIFHSDCLVQWLDKKQECPLCRSPVEKI